MSHTAEMQSLIARWEQSGLTQRAFTEQEGVSYSKFQYWRRRLGTARPAQRAKQRAAPVTLEPVRIIPEPLRSSASFELRTPTGLTVAVPTGFDELELQRLLDVLAGC